MSTIFTDCRWLSFSVLIVGILLRFLYLDSDPQYYEWIGYITDEGRWVQHARSLSLYGKLFDDNMDMHFYLAPIYQLANYCVFKLAGVSLVTSRLLSAFCGSAVLFLFWAKLRNVVSSPALFLGLTFLAFQLDLLVLSRIAVPETAAMFLQLSIYLLVLNSRQTNWRFALAGFLTLLAAGVKATTAALLPIFSVVILFMPQRPNEARAWRALLRFWAGLILPSLLIALLLAICLPEQSAMLLEGSRDLWNGVLKQFLHLSTIYNVVSFPILDSVSPTVNLWLLGVWLSALGWMAADRQNIDFEAYRYLVTSAVWCVGYFSLMLAMEYFPTRYKVHVLIPMAICLTVGISVLQRVGLHTVFKSFGKLDRANAVFWLLFLCLPTAVVLSPVAAWVFGYVSVDPERLGIKLACIIILLVGTTYIAGRFKHNHWAIGFLVIFPLIGGIVWAILSTFRSGYTFWPSAANQYGTASYVLLLVASAGIAIALGRLSVRSGLLGCTFALTICAFLYMIISLPRIAPGYINPHYSIRDASRDLGTILSSQSAIMTIAAEGLFNGNALRYKSFMNVNWPVEKPQIAVVAFRNVERMPLFKQNYHFVKSYKIFVSPEYYRAGGSGVLDSFDGFTVTVFKKNGTSSE